MWAPRTTAHITSLADRCLLAFALDYPAYAPRSAGLDAHVTELGPKADTLLAGLDAAILAADRAGRIEVESRFVRECRVEIAAMGDDPLLVGEFDHFALEEQIRRGAVLTALTAGDIDRVNRLLRPGAGVRSPWAHADVAPWLANEWALIEQLVDAQTRGDARLLVDVADALRRVSSARRGEMAPLRDAYKAVRTRIGRPPRAAASLPDDAITATYVTSVLGASVVSVTIARPTADDRLVVVTAPQSDVVALLVDPVTGSPMASWRCAAGTPTVLLLRAFAPVACPVEVTIERRSNGVATGSAVVRVDAASAASVNLLLTGAVPGLGGAGLGAYPHPAVLSGVGVTAGIGLGAPAIVANSIAPTVRTLALTQSLTPDPQLRQALEFMLTRGAISDSDLFSLGGAALVRRWSIQIDDFARRGGFGFAMVIGADGKVYRAA